jgi:hypothetical protein
LTGATTPTISSIRIRLQAPGPYRHPLARHWRSRRNPW